MSIPGARKDGRSLFLPYASNNCLTLQTITKGVYPEDRWTLEDFHQKAKAYRELVDDGSRAI